MRYFKKVQAKVIDFQKAKDQKASDVEKKEAFEERLARTRNSLSKISKLMHELQNLKEDEVKKAKKTTLKPVK